MRILIDMNLSPAWSAFLNAHDIAAVHWSNVGPAFASDADIMRYAVEFDYYVMTNDLDFGSILAVTRGGKPSVIQIRSDDLSTARIGRAVIAALRQSVAHLEECALLAIDPNRVRIRLLPLNSR
jgi:predicted nuclease of predicted toxin-antitoxin system